MEIHAGYGDGYVKVEGQKQNGEWVVLWTGPDDPTKGETIGVFVKRVPLMHVDEMICVFRLTYSYHDEKKNCPMLMAVCMKGGGNPTGVTASYPLYHHPKLL